MLCGSQHPVGQLGDPKLMWEFDLSCGVSTGIFWPLHLDGLLIIIIL